MSINRDEWLSAVKEAEHVELPETDALTLAEFGALIGRQRCGAKRRMDALLAAGRAVRVSKRIRRLDGNIVVVNAYRLVEPKRARKA